MSESEARKALGLSEQEWNALDFNERDIITKQVRQERERESRVLESLNA